MTKLQLLALVAGFVAWTRTSVSVRGPDPTRPGPGMPRCPERSEGTAICRSREVQKKGGPGQFSNPSIVLNWAVVQCARHGAVIWRKRHVGIPPNLAKHSRL